MSNVIDFFKKKREIQDGNEKTKAAEGAAESSKAIFQLQEYTLLKTLAKIEWEAILKKNEENEQRIKKQRAEDNKNVKILYDIKDNKDK